MRMFFTDDTFIIGSKAYPDIPFLVADSGWPVEPVNNYLEFIATVNGRSRSPRTWSNYGYHLYDYFSFLEANKLMWDDEHSSVHPLIQWRNWGATRTNEDGFRSIADVTVNQRLSTVCRFYEWASFDGYMETLPFKISHVRVKNKPNSNMLAHLGGGDFTKTNNITYRTFKKMPKIAPRDEIQFFIAKGLKSRKDKLMALLMVQCGLRRSEAVSIPEKYIFDPIGRPGLKPNMNIEVRLEPREMTIKYDNPRTIAISPKLMSKLWAYKVSHRSIGAKLYKAQFGHESSRLFLSKHGTELTAHSITERFWDAQKRTGLKIYPHVLRHTYATWELYLQSKVMNGSNALFHVMEKLGHKSITTTMTYLHLVKVLEFIPTEAYQSEIDNMLDGV